MKLFKPSPLIGAMLDTFLVLMAIALIMAVLLVPYATWMIYGFSFQFAAAAAVLIFVLFAALTSR